MRHWTDSLEEKYSPVLAVKPARSEDGALGDGKRWELARLGALEEEVQSALLELSSRLSNGHREESSSKKSGEDGLHG